MSFLSDVPTGHILMIAVDGGISSACDHWYVHPGVKPSATEVAMLVEEYRKNGFDPQSQEVVHFGSISKKTYDDVFHGRASSYSVQPDFVVRVKLNGEKWKVTKKKPYSGMGKTFEDIMKVKQHVEKPVILPGIGTPYRNIH